MTDTIFTNARIVTPESIVAGTLVARGGLIGEYDEGTVSVPAEDAEGDFLIPGLVELHTDHLESHYSPRPGVAWPAVSAVIAHDAQIVAAGITTVFDALRAGTFDPGEPPAYQAFALSAAISAAQGSGVLRASHYIHLRCELPCADTCESVLLTAETGPLHLVSIMDHTPGARQFVSIDKFREYYLGKNLIQPDRIDAYIAERLDMRARYAAGNKANILEIVRERGIKLASHDDATESHVDEALADGVAIAEFPTTKEAAHAAHRNGLSVLMGAPNVVRGGSHSGNISAAEIAASGHLDVLSSDYVPASLLTAAFTLSRRLQKISLPDALRLVTLNPAHAAGLDDRGAILPGRRADLIQVRVVDELPVVRKVWRQGQRVM